MIKRLLAIVAAVVLLGNASLAQAEGYAGFKAGANLASFTGDGTSLLPEFPDTRTGFTGGGFIGFDSGKYLGFRTDLLYTMKGAVNEDLRLSVELDYLEAATLLVGRFDLPGRFAVRVVAGPVFGMWINAEADNGPVDQDIGEAIEHLEISGTIGAELNVMTGPYIALLEARFTQGTRVFEPVMVGDEEIEIGYKNQGISVMAGLMVPF